MRVAHLVGVILVATCAIAVGSVPVWASACETSGSAAGDALVTEVECSVGDATTDASSEVGQEASPAAYSDYVWASVCAQFEASGEPSPRYLDCPAARNCADPNERVWQLWG